MFLLIKNAELYAPEYVGTKDILTAAGKILAIADRLDSAGLPAACDVLDARGLRTCPGLVDGHVHITGGGGEGGFKTRTPELGLLDASMAGVTTVVGVLGTDGVSRSLEDLVAKVYALREEGISAWCYTGSYRLPPVTLTGDSMKDIMMVEPMIGVGELAISDHRSSRPSVAELAKAASAARVGGMLSGKAGMVNIHLGDAAAGMGPLEEIVAAGDLPRSQFLPTHCARNPALFNSVLAWMKAGGYADFTASSSEDSLFEGEIPAGKALARVKAEGIPLSQATISSDGQGSLPVFDGEGRLMCLTVGSCSSLLDTLREAVDACGLGFSEAIATASANPAAILGLRGKGRIEVGRDADFLVLGTDWRPVHVVAMGRTLVADGKARVRGTFESPKRGP